MAEKLQKVTRANVGLRNNVGVALNTALVTVQEHNKIVDAVNLLIDDDNTSGYVIVEVKIATAASATTDFANLKAWDIVVLISTAEAVASRFDVSAGAVGASDIIPAVGELIIILRAASLINF